MKPWREVAVPHKDVLEGTFQQSEFAADITAVRNGRATHEYQDAPAFYRRTFITEGMRRLLTQVAERLNGRGGEPVIQLQTAFGGGKTHTMLAVYHLARREGALSELAGIPALLEAAGILDVPRANIAVLDGNNHAPGQPWMHGTTRIHTLWGELAMQLGGDEGFARVREADASGTSPGKETLRALLERFAPCVVLVDEMVAYVRQFSDGQALSGGTYDSNLSFAQALTEAAKLVPNAIVLASLPESEVEAGSTRGASTLRALEKTFGRVQALWKPVATEEAFEIVRRRLFEPINDSGARDETCREFAKLYLGEGAKVPSEVHEGRYTERLQNAYPMHPELFDRLYEDWTTLEGFQRTRGVLKLMARVIHRLWKDNNQDTMILPASLPLQDPGTRNDLLYYLPAGWDAVVERDIDGDRSDASEIDTREPRFGALNAARRVARTIFFGTAPSSGGTHKGTRGVDRARVILGCLQPGQSAAVYSDALNRLVDKLHYLSPSGDKTLETTRYWFDTRATLRREMEDRKGRFEERGEVRKKLEDVLKKLTHNSTLFEGVHVFTPSSDIPDDSSLRLVVLPPDKPYSKQDPRLASEEVLEIVRANGAKPRYRGNRLVFLAADQGTLQRLRDSVRTALAWGSIVEDIKTSRLNVDRLQEAQAQKEWETAESVVPRAARECFKWMLSPVMHSPTDRTAAVESFPLATAGASIAAEFDRVCRENEVVIAAWSPIHLRARLKELYWKPPTDSVGAAAVWEDMQRYLYLPRLSRQSVFEQALSAGATSRDFFGTAYGRTAGKFEGFHFGVGNVQFNDTLLLIEPSVAAAVEEDQRKSITTQAPLSSGPVPPIAGRSGTSPSQVPIGGASVQAKSFFGSVEVKAATAKMNLVSIADEIVSLLAQDPNAKVRVTVEIHAEFPGGVADQTKRAVIENATALGFKPHRWE